MQCKICKKEVILKYAQTYINMQDMCLNKQQPLYNYFIMNFNGAYDKLPES